VPEPLDPMNPADPDRRRQLGVLLFGDAEPLDAIGPAQVLWTLGAVRRYLPPFPPVDVHLVAEHAGPVGLAHGLVVHATTSYDDCPPLDALIVPGGSGDEEQTDAGRRFHDRYEPTLAFVRRQAAHASITASVCTGSFILAGAGLLAGRRAATHWTARDELVARMAERGEPFELVIERVVDDGPVVTGGGVSSGIDVALHLVSRLFGDQVRDAVALGIEVETPGAA
jgi:cyclohexyl-isocyanide hydratase